MLSARFVRLIESHSEDLANRLVDRLYTSPRTTAYRRIPREELRTYAVDIYRHLGDWLVRKTDEEVGDHYKRIGEKRAEQGIEFSQFIWALILTKESLWKYLQANSYAERAVELFGELELLVLIEQFFDQATYYAIAGYEESAKLQKTA
jgi:hypothetical protein